MRALVAKRFEGTILVSLSCLSLSLFLLLLFLVIGQAHIIGNPLLCGVAIISSGLILRSFIAESKKETFDLTIPTIFDSGLLAFQSQKEKTAVFFSFRLSSSALESSNAKRTLTILFKILPVSTICSFEWISPEEYFINFFIKLKNEAFLTRIQELVENITTSVTTLLSPEEITILKGEELISHFSMGIAGHINRVSVAGRNSVLIQSNDASEKRVVTSFGALDEIDVNCIFEGHPESQNLRVILSVQREVNHLKTFNALAVISTQPLNDFASTHIIEIPIRKSIRAFGDILSRNLVQIMPITIDYQSLAQIVFNQISSVHESQRARPIQSEGGQLTSAMSPLAWRSQLAKFSSNLGLPFSTNTQILIEGIPMRIDARIDNLVFFIISQNIEEQISWLVEKTTAALNSEQQIELAFLITNPSQINILEGAISQTPLLSKIHIISERTELETLLKEYRSRAVVDHELLTQVA